MSPYFAAPMCQGVGTAGEDGLHRALDIDDGPSLFRGYKEGRQVLVIRGEGDGFDTGSRRG